MFRHGSLLKNDIGRKGGSGSQLHVFSALLFFLFIFVCFCCFGFFVCLWKFITLTKEGMKER